MNPFIYGEEVVGEHFINRSNEIKALVKDLNNCKKIFLIARRRYGKTSLLRAVENKIKKQKMKVVYVDIFKCASLERFVAELAKSMAALETISIDKAMKIIKEWISGLRPQFSVNRVGELSVNIDSMPKKKETLDILEELLQYAQIYAEKNKSKVAIIFDEFQEILKFGGESIEKFMRAIIQRQRNVGYVFCGSKRSVLDEMATKQSRAFFNSGPIMYIDKININDWEQYLVNEFTKGSYKIGDKVVQGIIGQAENIPYYIQAVANELWDMKSDNKEILNEDVEEAVISIVKKRAPSSDTLWNMLPGTQQRLLIGMAENSNNIFSVEFIIRWQLGSRSTVEQAIKLLEKKDIIEKDGKEHVFVDLWLKKWIKYIIIEAI